MAKILQPEKLQGKYVNLREVTIDDAEFILKLRCNEKKSRYIHKTENNIEKQKEYIKKYLTLDNELYFIVEKKNGIPIGTHSIYPYPILAKHWRDKQNVNFGVLGTGRWISVDGLSPMESLEGDYLVKLFFFETLKRPFSPMMIHKDNKQVLNYNKKWGAKIFGYDEKLKHYLLDLKVDQFNKNRSFFERFLYNKKEENDV